MRDDINEIVEQQGWNQGTLLSLATIFMEENDQLDSFADFLEARAEEENDEEVYDEEDEGDD